MKIRTDAEIEAEMLAEKDRLIPLMGPQEASDAALDLIESSAAQLETLQRITGMITVFTAMAANSKAEDPKLVEENQQFADRLRMACFRTMDAIIMIRLHKEKFLMYAKHLNKIAYEDESKN